MYSVSDAYKTAISADSIKNRVSGTITLTNGSVIMIDDSRIVTGSLSIDNKCVNNSEFSLGSVYVGQMSVTLYISDTVSRYSLYDAKIELSYYLTLTDGTEEPVPLGVYYVEKATRSKKFIALTAYDVMTDFDETIEADTWGQPFDLFSLACKKCGVEFGSTQEEIEALPNGTTDMTLQKDRVSTYRDMLSYLSETLCAFATIDRTGKLVIRKFHTTSDLTVSARRRMDSTIHDYETYFNSVTARFIAEQNYYPYTETDEERETGLLLDLGDIPTVQGVEETKHGILKNILTEIENIRYTPSEFSMVSDPSFDLGDCLTLENVNNTTDSAVILVTAIKWNYRNTSTITANGTDALLENISDSTSKQISQVETEAESKTVVVKTFTNASAYTLDGSETEIIRLSWSAFEDTTAVFVASIQIEMSDDGNLVLNYFKSLLNVGTWTKYLPKGKHIVTISTYVPSEQSEEVSWRVRASIEYTESKDRVHDAKIISLWNYAETGTLNDPVIDMTVPKGTIDQEGIRAVVFAQGINSTEAWDGTIELLDDLTGYVIPFTGIDVDTNLTEIVTSGFIAPEKRGLTDTVTTFEIASVDVNIDLDEEVRVNKPIMTHTAVFTMNEYTEKVDDVIQLKTSYIYNGTDDTIDSGKLISCQVMTSDKQTIEDLTVVIE